MSYLYVALAAAVAGIVGGFFGGFWFANHRAQVASAAARAVTLPSGTVDKLPASVAAAVKTADAAVVATVSDTIAPKA